MNKTPEIRFKGFSDDWEEKKLGEISDKFGYGLNASAKKYDGENKYIRITDIDDSSHKFLGKNITSPNIDLTNSNDYLLKEGDILLARTGASVGKSYKYNKSDGKVYYAGFLIRFSLKLDYNVDFVFQNTLTDKYNNFIRITSQRSGQPGVNAKEYSSFKLNIPSLPEQEKIGDFFKQLDDHIALCEEEVESLKLSKKGFLQKMFPKKGERVPEIRFPEFTDDWEEKKFEGIFNYERPDKYIVSSTEYLGSGTPVLTANKSFILGYTNEKNVFNKGEVIIFDDFTLDNKYVDFSFMVKSSAIKILYAKKDINLYFAFELLNHTKIEQEGHARHYISIVQKKKILIPTLPEQEKIGAFFKQLDDNIKIHEEKLEALKKSKKAFLQKLLT